MNLAELLFPLFASYFVTSPGNTNVKNVTIPNLVDALDNLLDYFILKHAEVNLDAIICSRIIEGQLESLQSTLKSLNDREISKLPPNFLEKVTDLLRKSFNFSSTAEEPVSHLTPKYYSDMKHLIRKGILTFPNQPHRKVNQSLVYQSASTSPLALFILQNPSFPDCLVNLKEDRGFCNLSKECWQRMTVPQYSGYSLTHQLFYLFYALQTGCIKEMSELSSAFGQNSVESLIQQFCTNVLHEMEQSQFSKVQCDRDLFWEQIAFCGMLGFEEVYKKSWAEYLLNSQNPKLHCYGTTAHGYKRRKRDEKQLDDGCQVHETGVAGGAFAVYLRVMTENILKSPS